MKGRLWKGAGSYVFAPAVLSGKQDVLPSERRDVGEKRGIGRLTGGGKFADDASELAGVPANAGGGEQVQPCHAMMLALWVALAWAALPDRTDHWRSLKIVQKLELPNGIGFHNPTLLHG